MAAGDLSLNLIIGANADGAMSVVAGLGTTLTQLASGNVLGAVAAAGAAAGAALVGAAKSAGDFNASLTQLVTGAGESASNLKMVSDGLLQMSVDTGTSTKDLASALFLIESSGQRGAAGLDTLRIAAEGAKVGNADLTTTANNLTTILTDYHIPAEQATAAMNGFITAVSEGKPPMRDWGNALGAVLPLAASLKISFPQVAAAISVMTNAGMDAQRSSQDLANAIRALSAPSSIAIKWMTAVGINAQQLNDTLSTKGLTGAIQLVTDAVGKRFPAGSIAAQEALKGIMGGATGLNVALMLGGKNMETYKSDVDAITKAMNDGSGSVINWDMVQQDFNFKVQQAQQALSAMMITVGQELLPIFGKMIDGVTKAITGFTQWESQTHFVERALNAVVTAIGWLADGLGKVMDVLSQLWGLVAPFFDDLAKAAVNWGQNFLAGFAQGIMSVAQDLINAVAQVAQEIADYLGFASPTRKGPGSRLNTWGQGMMAGLTQGIVSSLPMVTNAVARVASNLATLGSPSTALSMVPNVSMMADKLTGDTRRVTVTPIAPAPTQLQMPGISGLSGASSPTGGTTTNLTGNLAKGLLSGTGQVAAAANSVGQQLHVVCGQHAKAASQCAADHLTKHLATALHAGKEHVAAAAHAVGQGLHHVATHAKTAAHAAKQSLIDQLASQARAGAAPVQSAVSSVSHAIDTALSPISKTANNAAKSVTQALGPAATAIKNAWSGVAGFFGQIGAAIQRTFKAMLPGLQDIWRVIQTQLLPSLKGLWDAIQPLVVGIGQLVAAAALGVVEFGKWMVQSGALKAMWDGFVTGVKGAIAVISTIINAISDALAPVIRQIVTTFNTQLKPAWDHITAAMAAAMPAITAVAKAIGAVLIVALGVLVAIISGVMKAIGNLVAGLVSAFGGIVQMLSGVVQVIAGILAFLYDLFTGNFKKLGADIQVIWQGIVDFFVGLWHTITGLVGGFFGAIYGFFEGFIKGIIGFFQHLYDALVGHSIIPDLINGITGWFTQLVTDVTDLVNQIVTRIVDQFTQFKQNVLKAWTDVYNYVVNAVKQIQTNVKTVISAVLNFISTQWNTLVTNTKNNWSAFLTAISSALTTALNTIKSWFTQLGPNMLAWGGNMLQMFGQGIANGAHWVIDQLKNLGQNIANFLGFHSPPPAGPLASSGTWMPNMMTMFGQGISQNTSKVTTPIISMAGQIGSQFALLNGQVSTSIAGITSKFGVLTSSAQQAAGNVNASMSGMSSHVATAGAAISASVSAASTAVSAGASAIGASVSTTSSQVSAAMSGALSAVSSGATRVAAGAQKISDDANLAALLAKDAAKTAADRVQEGAQVVALTAKQLVDAAEAGKKSAQSLPPVTAAAGADAIQRFVSAIEAGGPAALAAASAIAGAVAAILGHSKPKIGPLKDDDLWGKHFVENISEGIHKGMPRLKKDIDDIAQIMQIVTTPGKYMTTTANIQGDIPITFALTPAMTQAFALPQPSSGNDDRKTDIQVNLDGKAIMKAVGVRMAKEIRVQGNIRNT